MRTFTGSVVICSPHQLKSLTPLLARARAHKLVFQQWQITELPRMKCVLATPLLRSLTFYTNCCFWPVSQQKFQNLASGKELSPKRKATTSLQRFDLSGRIFKKSRVVNCYEQMFLISREVASALPSYCMMQLSSGPQYFVSTSASDISKQRNNRDINFPSLVQVAWLVTL